jgi:phosphate transport system permease protein
MILTGYSKKARLCRQFLALTTIRVSAALVLGIMATIVVYIVAYGFSAINLAFLTEFPKESMTKGGIFPAIVGTLCLALGSMVVSLPLGFGAAIFLSEYTRPGKMVTLIRLGVTNLAGVPSVVFGLFGLVLFVNIFGFGRSLLSGCFTLGLLTLPTIIASSEEALRQTPTQFREAALALGANRWQAIRQVVLPVALPGMLTGTILALGRAAGETAPITFTATAIYTALLPDSVFSEVMALPTHIFNLASNGNHIEATRNLQFGSALVLLFLALGLSIFAIIIRAKLRRKRTW